MSDKKGMKHYPEVIKSEIANKVQNGQPVNSPSKYYDMQYNIGVD